jgi:hypothetical protein
LVPLIIAMPRTMKTTTMVTLMTTLVLFTVALSLIPL